PASCAATAISGRLYQRLLSSARRRRSEPPRDRRVRTARRAKRRYRRDRPAVWSRDAGRPAMAAPSSLACIGTGRRFFPDAHRTGGRQNDDWAKLGGGRLVRCPANRRFARTICASQARTAENQGECRRQMSGRASVIGKKGAVRDLAWGPDGLADVVPTDQGSVPSLRRIAKYAR